MKPICGLWISCRVHWQNGAHFYGIAAELMRRILVDRARRRRRIKRGGGASLITLDQGMVISRQPAVDVIAIDEALTKLARIDKRKARIVELRFFGGLEVEETAAFLEISETTVMREWKLAKAWLHREMSNEPGRWQKLDELFHSALERDGEARPAFLAKACGGDTELL
jgi:RNA polymerase sigma-70 factor, ECF subfamily